MFPDSEALFKSTSWLFLFKANKGILYPSPTAMHELFVETK